MNSSECSCATKAQGSPYRAFRVYLVDDSAPVRVRIAGLLRDLNDDIDIVGEAESPAEATRGILVSRPDAVLLDLQLTGGSGLDVLKAIHPVRPAITFIVLSNHAAGQHYERACMTLGASHVLDKSHDFNQIARILADLRNRHVTTGT